MALVTSKSLGERLFKNLRGYFCIYKPPDRELKKIDELLKMFLVAGINNKPCRPVEKMVQINENDNSVNIMKNLADSPLAAGRRYIRKDFEIQYIHQLDDWASGVQMCVLNDTAHFYEKFSNMRLMRVYHLEGRLGVATDNFMPHGRLIEKSTYSHVNRAKLDRIMSSIQATYQREMFRYFGVNLNSQEAYDLASSGLLRPGTNDTPPIIYSIKCLELNKPFFKLEIHTINETCRFLRELVHDIGYQLKTNAICTSVRRVKDGFIDVNYALSHIKWNFETIYDNLKQINQITNENIKKYKQTVLVNSTKNDELKLLGVQEGQKLIDLHKNE